METEEAIVTTTEGLRFRCWLCKTLFVHDDIYYIRGDVGYTQLCATCCETPVAQRFLPYMERLARGLVSDEESRNWNAFHDW